MQRSSVVFPEPLGPITTTTSPGLTASETSRSTSTEPKRLCNPAISSTGRCWPVAETSMAEEDASFKMPSIESQGIANAKIDRRGAEEDLEWRERALDDFAARHCQLPQSDDRDQRGRLDQTDTETDIGWRREAQSLRQDHEPQHQAAGHAKTARRIPLRLRQRQYPGSKNFTDERGVVERDDQYHAGKRRQVDAGQRHQVIDKGQQHQERDAAYQKEIAEDHRARQAPAKYLQQREQDAEDCR